MNEQPEFDADVREIATQLSNTDFSTESRIHSSLRQRLLHQNAQPRRSLALLRLATLAATIVLVMVGMAVLLPSFNRPQSGLATEIRLQPEATEAVRITPEKQRLFYEVESLQDSVNYDVYYPKQLPEGYAYAFSHINGERVKTIFHNKKAWESALIANNAYEMALDYLYLIQQPKSDEPIPLINPFATGSIRYTFVQVVGEIGITKAATEDARSALIALWSDDEWDFQMWSYQFTEEELEAVALSVVPYREVQLMTDIQTAVGYLPRSSSFPALEGSCQLQDAFPLERLEWQSPLISEMEMSLDVSSQNSDGVTLKAVLQDPVYAAVNGWVVFAGETETKYGNAIIIWTGDYYVLYGYLDTISTRCSRFIRMGQQIGSVGETGDATEPSLRFEVIDNDGHRIDPQSVLSLEAAP